ncbi:hypothetical protein NC652_012713 [Populus alba x Populus x berolinensis]|nr:hypothetical protein NC652_012713 [Populus alba x Populus x berolinensis]
MANSKHSGLVVQIHLRAWLWRYPIILWAEFSFQKANIFRSGLGLVWTRLMMPQDRECFELLNAKKAKTAIAFWRCLKFLDLTEKIVGIKTPKEPPGHWLAAWCFSIGEESFNEQRNIKSEKSSEEGEDEKGFVTLVRFIEDNPIGKPTALLYWKKLPKEDAIAAAAITRTNINAWLHTQSSTGTHHPPFVFFFPIRTGLWFCPLPWIFFLAKLHYSDMMDDASLALPTSRDFTSLL